jgi:hypothetical protein
MKNSRSAISTLALLMMAAGTLKAGIVYDANSDFSTAVNPNGAWSYLFSIGSVNGVPLDKMAPFAPGLVGWTDGLEVANAVNIWKNTTTSTINHGTIASPPGLLGMDPQSYTAITRWTTPSAGTWTISGLFQGIDTGQYAHNVEIIVNSSTQLLSPTTISSLGQQVTFNDTVNLSQGDTVNFIVLTGSGGGFSFMSTGLEATISAVPEPSVLLLAGLGLVAIAVLHSRRRKIATA